MEQGAQYAKLTKHLAGAGVFRDRPFTLIDVGCSGGISKLWRSFEPALQGVGVDPLADECRRLSSEEQNPLIRYFPAFIHLPSDKPPRQALGGGATSRNPWTRLSAHAASEILRSRIPAKSHIPTLNLWKESADQDVPRLGVNEVARIYNLNDVDFIKIDIDGLDLDALLSAENVIRNSPVLGLALEVNFYGSHSDSDNSFHNTDRVMREWGFDLFDLTVRRYSSAALPQPSVWDIPAQTVRGRPYQGDAIYLRDPCSWSLVPESAVPLRPTQILKLVCLFELFGLPDHSCELLMAQQASLESDLAVDELLDLLAGQVDPVMPTYRKRLEQFRRDPTSLYPSRNRKL